MVSHGHEHCPHCGVELQGDEPLCPSCSGALFGVARRQSKTEIAKETAKEIASRTSDAISTVSEKASALGKSAMSTVGDGIEKASTKIGEISMPTLHANDQSDEDTGMIPIMDAQDAPEINNHETPNDIITETIDETSRLVSEGRLDQRRKYRDAMVAQMTFKKLRNKAWDLAGSLQGRLSTGQYESDDYWDREHGQIPMLADIVDAAKIKAAEEGTAFDDPPEIRVNGGIFDYSGDYSLGLPAGVMESKMKITKKPFIQVELCQNENKSSIHKHLEHFYIENNKLLDKPFVSWYVKTFYGILLDDEYSLSIIDSDVNMFKLNSEQYVILTENKKYLLHTQEE